MTERPEFPPEQVAEARAWLAARGATEADLAVHPSDLPGVALELRLERDASLSACDLAGRLGSTVDEVVEIFGELGIAVPDVDEVRFTEAEVAFVQLLREAVVARFTPEEGHQLIVVVARALRSMADAGIAAFVQTIETRLLAGDPTLVEWTEATADTAELGVRLGDSLGVLFGHYLRQAAQRQRAAQEGVSSRAVMRVAVGFVDLVGFTPLSSTLTPEELSAMMGEFESQAFDLAVAAGAQIVKHIGDEIMFTAVDPAAACDLALELRDSVEATTALPRGGVAYGEVITRHGDYYGPVVNLASRLTAEAVPGEVLIPQDLRDALPDREVEPAGRRLLKGFAEPVRVFSLGS
ncbi:MAG: adenylate/guanylate cyclase domain-containing protein [Acidimicrobiales bacterium]|nr:adenylate/guanylate cyclase domain-containing protein [Acidimicrobiales bacterium]